MAYYTPNEIKEILHKFPQFKDSLYCRGFLLTNDKQKLNDNYPFYANWNEKTVSSDEICLYLYTHKETYSYTYTEDRYTYFIVGHAYDPFNMITDENKILKALAKAMKKGEEYFWKAESNLTGVFCIGYVEGEQVVYSTDCAGMQLVYHGTVAGQLYITSHSKLVADLKGLEQSKYIRKLVSSRFWHYWGTWLPGDLSPFDELKRMQPNCAGRYSAATKVISVVRYYPFSKIEEIGTEEEYINTIHELGRIMSNTMSCISEKWSDKKISISVTGGRDSMTALACANDQYDKYSYFSYISNQDEAVDADAAKKILNYLGLTHELYTIPEKWQNGDELTAYAKVMQCNAGCIGENNANDIRKRLFFLQNPPCEIEIKSWVNEMGRGWYYNKYNKKKFPKYPSASYWRAMHKIYVSPWLIHNTTKVFQDYLDKYYTKEVFDELSWLELYFWEFAWSGGEGVFLTSEQRMSYDITIPFNNRRYIELMLTVPIEKRKSDAIPNDLITYMEPKISETGIVIKDVSHTNLRALIVRSYLELFSRIHI